MLDSALSDFTGAPPLISGPLFGILFFWLMAALGRRLLRLVRLSLVDFNVWERGLLAAAIGLGTIQLLPLALAAVGRLYRFEIQVALLVIALILWRDLTHVARRFVAEIRGNWRWRPERIQLVWFTLVLAFMVVWLVHALTFGPFGDDDGIHLAAPKRWLAAGTLSYLPSYSLTNASLGFDMLYLIGLAVWSPVGAKMIHYSTGVFALMAIVLAARRISSPTAGILAVSVMLIGTPVSNLPVLFGNAMIDLASVWMTLMSVLVWLVWREKADSKLLLCMALMAGFAASFKLTSVQVAIAWVPVLSIDARRRGVSWSDLVKLTFMFGVVAALPVLPWFARNLLVTGNPLFPMFTSFIPTRDWSLEHADVFSRYTKFYAWGISAGTYLDEAGRKLVLFAAAGAVGVVLAIGSFFVRAWVSRALICFAGVFIVISIALTGLIFRYWLPATIVLALVAAVAADRRFPQRALWGAAVMLMAVALVVQARRGFFFHQPAGFAGDLRMALGMSSFEREYAEDSLVQVWRHLNISTPPEAQILFGAFYTTFGASSYAGFWVNRMCYTTDTHLQTYFRFDSWEAFTESVERAGITHVVVGTEQFNSGRHGFSFTAGENEFPFLRRLVAERGDRVFEAYPAEVYRLRPSRAARRIS